MDLFGLPRQLDQIAFSSNPIPGLEGCSESPHRATLDVV